MSLIPNLTTGDDIILPVQLYKSAVNFVINGTATVKASIVSKDRKKILVAPVTLSKDTTGADWFNSLLIVEFAAADTTSITSNQLGSVLLEIQVDDGGKLTWFAKVKLVQGTIDQ